MEPDSQTCPSCKTSKYNDPRLRLMVNICGHPLCENCVEVLFVRGSGLCVQCKTPIRKANFRYQLFEDPTVQKEVDIRKKIITEFNKREEDFENIEDYDKYLEMIEDIIYKLSNDMDVDKTKKFIEQYKKDNKDIIKRNRTKQSNCNEFYERELEQERILRERRADARAAEEATEIRRRKRLHAARTLQGFLCGAAAVILPEESKPIVDSHIKPLSSDHFPPPVPSSALLESKHRFLPPPSTASHRPVPPSAASRWSGVSQAPVSSIVGVSQLFPPSNLPPSSWATSAEHHSVVIPPPHAMHNIGQTDMVVLSRPHAMKSSSLPLTTAASDTNRSLKEWLEPYRPEMCGPQPPSPADCARWNALETVYLKAVVEPTTEEMNAAANTEERAKSFRTYAHTDEGDNGNATDRQGREVRRGLAHSLPRGACGIAPCVYMTRALEESRYGLFI